MSHQTRDKRKLTKKQCSTTIQPQPPSGGSSYWISCSFSFLVEIAFFLNRFMAALVSLRERKNTNKKTKSASLTCSGGSHAHKRSCESFQSDTSHMSWTF